MAVNPQFPRTGKPLDMAEDKNPQDEINPDIALEEALVEELDARDLEIVSTAKTSTVAKWRHRDGLADDDANPLEG